VPCHAKTRISRALKTTAAHFAWKSERDLGPPDRFRPLENADTCRYRSAFSKIISASAKAQTEDERRCRLTRGLDFTGVMLRNAVSGRFGPEGRSHHSRHFYFAATISHPALRRRVKFAIMAELEEGAE